MSVVTLVDACYIGKRHANCLVLAIDSPRDCSPSLKKEMNRWTKTLKSIVYCRLLGVHFQPHSPCRSSTQLNFSLTNIGTALFYWWSRGYPSHCSHRRG